MLKDKNFKISYPQQLDIALSVAEGIEYLHKMKIIHRDIKAANVLVKVEGTDIMEVKVSDFGLSKQIEDGKLRVIEEGLCGTPTHMAPEIYNLKRYSFKSDVYAFGMLLWEISTRSSPFRKLKNSKNISVYVLSGVRPELKESERDCYNDLTTICWGNEYNRRPDMTKVADKLGEFIELTIDVQRDSGRTSASSSTPKITEITNDTDMVSVSF